MSAVCTVRVPSAQLAAHEEVSELAIQHVVHRWLGETLLERLADESIVLLSGPRAVGKSTLVTAIATGLALDVLDLGDDATFAVAAQDPAGYVAGLPEPIVIDEYQRLPALLRVAKRSVDRNRRSGAFVFTGSTTGALLPTGSESLTGRSHEMVLWGLSQGELIGRKERFVDLAFGGPEALGSIRERSLDRTAYVDLVVAGGYPEAIARQREQARRRWFDDYLKRVIDRDLAELVSLRQPAALGRVARAAGARTAQVLNVSSLAGDLDLNRDLVSKYLDLLREVYLVRELPAYSRNRTSRLTKHPKLHIADSGLAAALCAIDAAGLRRSPMAGALLETFVVSELVKQLGWATTPAELFHFRDRDGHEVDVVLAAPDGRVVGIEVKAATSVGPTDLVGLRHLAETVGDDLVAGIVLYTGSATIRLGDDDRFRAMPVSALWRS